MVNVKEIHIGSLLKTNFGEIIKVDSIGTKKQNRKVGYHRKGESCHIRYVRLAQCEPIPLTKEILMANGWVSDSPNVYTRKQCDFILNTYDSHKGFSTAFDDLVLTAEFAHELQNALVVCGCEDLADNLKVEDICN